MPSHNHSFTPSGTVSSHNHYLPSHNHSFRWSGSHGHILGQSTSVIENFTRRAIVDTTKDKNIVSVLDKGVDFASYYYNPNSVSDYVMNNFVASPSEIIIEGNTSSTSTSIVSSDSRPTFTGTLDSTSSVGSGTSFSILPPYVVKYCWERTA